MKAKVLKQHGAYSFQPGQVVELAELVAQQLVKAGYVEAVTEAPTPQQQPKEDTPPAAEGGDEVEQVHTGKKVRRRRSSHTS